MTFLNVFVSIVLSLSCEWDSRTADTPRTQASHPLGISSTKKECCLGSHLLHINTCGMKNNNNILTSCGLSRKNNNKRGIFFHECSQSYVLIFFVFQNPFFRPPLNAMSDLIKMCWMCSCAIFFQNVGQFSIFPYSTCYPYFCGGGEHLMALFSLSQP